MEQKFAVEAYKTFLLWGVLSALGTAASTLVDAVLIGNFIGEDGLAASNVATPVFLIYALFGVTLAVGANVRMGNLLGKGETEQANRLFHQQLLLGLLVSVVCTGAGVLFPRQILRMLGASQAVLELAQAYVGVVFLSAGVFVFYHILSYSVRSDGDPGIAGAASAVLVGLNILLDLLFLGVLRIGIVGASLALCIATLVAVLILLTHFFRKNALLRLGLRPPQGRALADFLANGFGTGSACLFQAVIMGRFNAMLLAQGAQGTFYVAFFGILYTMSTFAGAVFNGASAALTPVVSILSGEKDRKSILAVFRTALAVVAVLGVLIAAVYFAAAPQIVAGFGIQGAARQQAAAASFRLFACSLLFAGINTLVTSFWQSIGRPWLAGGMSVLRNLALMLLLGGLLLPARNINGLALTHLLCELLCALAAAGVLLVRSSDRVMRQAYAGVLRTFEKMYTIDKNSIAQIGQDMTAVSRDWQVDGRRAFFLNLIVEELILNIIKFGIADSAEEHYVALKLLENGDEYILRIRDDVASYDPFESNGDEIDNAAIRMIKKKAKYYSYQRKLIFNYLYVVL